MGDKYILELEDKPICVFDEDTQTYFPRLYRVKGFNSLVFDQNGLNNLTPYTEPDMEKVREEAYQNGYKDATVKISSDEQAIAEKAYQSGLNDAWEAAKKLQEIDMYTIREIFGWVAGERDVFIRYTATEAIEKIRQYEQEKEQQIQVGDEVRNIKGGWIAVVSNIDGECMTLMDTNEALGDGYDVNRFTKTGRHFPEIAEVLRKMKEES